MAQPPPRRVGGMSTADRPIFVYPTGKRPIDYEPQGTWIAVLILVVLFFVFFGILALWFAFWR